MFHPSFRPLFARLILSLLLAAPLPALAEVTDKEPALAVVWIVGLMGGVLCFASGYLKRWLVLLIALLPALWFASLLVEIHSPDVGPALRREQGNAYHVQAYISLMLFAAGCFLGFRNGGRGR